jgi:hypothetical protein
MIAAAAPTEMLIPDPRTARKPPPAPARNSFPWWIVFGATVLALGYLPTLFAPFDFIDDGNLVYPAPPGLSLTGHVERWGDRVWDNYEHLGPIRPVLWAHWELAANTLGGDPIAWRVLRMAWCGLAAGMLLWLMRELKVHPLAALVATAAAMWNPYRNEIWTSLTLAEGVAMPYALLALVAARKASYSRRSWVWDAAAILGLLFALGCKNVFVALIPAQVVLRMWPDGVSWAEGWSRNRWRAALYLLPLLPVVAHYIYFKLNWHPGQYETPGPSLEQAGKIASWMKGAAGLDFLGAGIALSLLALWWSRRQGHSIGLPAQPTAVALLAAVALFLAGVAVYLPLPMMAARYTMPAVWGLDLLFGLLLTALTTVPASWPKRAAWVAVAVGLAALAVAGVGRQERLAARSQVLWDALTFVEREVPPDSRIQWVGGSTSAGDLNPEEGIHFHWHLLHRGRDDFQVGLVDPDGKPIERTELKALGGPPHYRMSMNRAPDPGWEPVREFAVPYRLGKKEYRVRLDAAR